MLCSFSMIRLCAISLLAVLLAAPSVQAQSPAPTFHAGAVTPSLIPNHATTEVKLTGQLLTGATVAVSGLCTLESFRIVSDSELRVMLHGNRSVDDVNDNCDIHIRKGGKQVNPYLVVDLTDAEKQEQSVRNGKREQARDEAYRARLGTEWTLHYADGATEIFTAQSGGSGLLAVFTSSAGGTARIMLDDGNRVTFAAGECMRTGTLSGGEVKDGATPLASGQCRHAGAWTAHVK